jgi:hypothetical protein
MPLAKIHVVEESPTHLPGSIEVVAQLARPLARSACPGTTDLLGLG